MSKRCELLRSPSRGSNAKHHLRAAVQLDILLGAEQDAGSLSHSGILLPRHIVRQQHAENEKQLAGTPTLEVPAQAAQTFGMVDYPLGVVLDSSGTIRFIGVLPSDAFEGNGYVEKVLGRMLAKNTPKEN